MNLLTCIAKAKAAVALCLGLSACGQLDYDKVSDMGRFDGRLFVMWVGEGSPFSGDGRFVFIPNPRNPLTFTRIDASGAQIGLPFTPEMMYTDGGSIPRIFTVFKGFSPWGYAPAYMIHDWLFIANHCVVDGTPTEEQQKVAGMSFDTSAEIIAEAIKALQVSGQVERNDVSAMAISSAVAGPIARQAWRREGACAEHIVSDEHRRAALEAFPDSLRATPEDVGLPPDDTLGTGVLFVEPAILIGEFGF